MNHFGFVIGTIAATVIGGAVVLDHFTPDSKVAAKPSTPAATTPAPTVASAAPVETPAVESRDSQEPKVEIATPPKKVAVVTQPAPAPRESRASRTPAPTPRTTAPTPPSSDSAPAPLPTPVPAPAENVAPSNPPPAAPSGDTGNSGEGSAAKTDGQA